MSLTTARLAMMRAIRMHRARLDISQEALGRRMAEQGCEWDAKLVSRVETGERSVRWEEVVALCSALEVPLRRLLDDHEDDDRSVLGLPPQDHAL